MKPFGSFMRDGVAPDALLDPSEGSLIIAHQLEGGAEISGNKVIPGLLLFELLENFDSFFSLPQINQRNSVIAAGVVISRVTELRLHLQSRAVVILIEIVPK